MGGSFDPVQRGHVAVARAALRERGLKKVYLAPAGRSPFKHEGPRAPDADRLAMLRRAIRGQRGLAIGRWELNRPGPSYTYRTLRELRRRYPRRRWEVILGEDAWRDFKRWRRWREIMRRHVLVVARRGGAARGGEGAVFLNARAPGVSSTEVRGRLARGLKAGRLVPPGVAGYIRKRKLYSLPTREGRPLPRLRRTLPRKRGREMAPRATGG
jgi:nicotinate-nucleotide adenylyltransferase